jgi:hypothetical protein
MQINWDSFGSTEPTGLPPGASSQSNARCYFGSYVRYVTKFESYFLIFPSERLALMSSLALSGSDALGAFEANAVRPSMEACHVCLKGFSSFIPTLMSPDLLPSQLYLWKRYHRPGLLLPFAGYHPSTICFPRLTRSYCSPTC